jgi:hypothetical protein
MDPEDEQLTPPRRANRTPTSRSQSAMQRRGKENSARKAVFTGTLISFVAGSTLIVAANVTKQNHSTGVSAQSQIVDPTPTTSILNPQSDETFDSQSSGSDDSGSADVQDPSSENQSSGSAEDQGDDEESTDDDQWFSDLAPTPSSDSNDSNFVIIQQPQSHTRSHSTGS